MADAWDRMTRDERIRAVKAFWAEGLIMVEIAARLRTTKGSVAGLVWQIRAAEGLPIASVTALGRHLTRMGLARRKGNGPSRPTTWWGLGLIGEGERCAN